MRRNRMLIFKSGRTLQMMMYLLALPVFVAISEPAFAQDNVQITGQVIETISGDPLPGVTIIVKGTTVGTISDIDGNYSIEALSTDILSFSFVGYLNEEVLVGTNTRLDVSLVLDVIDLDEIVVVGYGVQKKSDLTGSVSSVSSEQLNSVPIPSIEHALQGMAAGVNIIPKSGKPGEGADIQIRGISSINGTKPLVIIDGVSGDLNQLNPSDIASIEVLKDASSAAIYGSTGGNGVILVTTKNGSSGKMKVSANVYHGINNPVDQLEMMNAQEYNELMEEIKATGTTPANLRPDTLQTYNWQDICFQQAITENYDLSVSGGNDVSTYLFSTSLSQQDGTIKNTDYQRFTIRINSEHKVNKHIIFDEKITFVNDVTEGYDEWYWHNYYNNPVISIMQADPTVPAYDDNGVWTVSNNNVGNPMVAFDMKDKTNKNNNIAGNFGLKINLVKGLDFQSRLTGKFGLNDAKEYQAIYEASPTDFNNQDDLIQSMKKNLSYNFQNFINYQTTLADDHNISAMIGMEAGKWWWYDISGTRVDMTSDNPDLLYLSKSINGEADLQNVEGTADVGANQAYFGRLNYNYKSKYLLTVNLRRDGSSNFHPDYRYHLFPSFSVGWKFTEENFMKNLPVISTGKIRFGYGQTGANAKNGFPYYSTVVTRPEFRYTVDGLATQVGTAPNQIANPSLQWESVNMSNLGLDMTFFQNRISFTVDLYEKVSDGMIIAKETSAIAGTYDGENPEINLGSISNKGVEITIGARKQTGELTGSIDLNLHAYKNKVKSLADDSLQSGKVHTLNPTSITMVGEPIAQFFGYELEGMFSVDDPTTVATNGKTIITNQPYYTGDDGTIVYAQPNALPGDARFKDLNGDGKINHEDRKVLGSPHPKLLYGFSLNLQYKGFDFSAFFLGSIGNDILNGTKQYLYDPVGYKNRGKDYADRYRDEIVKDGIVVVNENHNTDLYRLGANNYTKTTDFFVEDGSYLRLRNLVLGYTFPASITQKIGVEKLRLYAGAENLFTLTKYSGMNPEVGASASDQDTPILSMGVDYGLYPVSKMIYFGANIVF